MLFIRSKCWIDIFLSSVCVQFEETTMNRNQTTCSEEDFDFAGDTPKEDSVVAQVEIDL